MIFLLLSSFLVPALAPAAEAHAVILGDRGKAEVSLNDRDGATLSIRLPGGKTQKEAELGDEFVPFYFESKRPSEIVAVDFDGDGVEEFVVRASIPPIDGALMIYYWDSPAKRFKPYTYEGDDYLPVDATAPVKVSASGRIQARVLLYGEGDEPTTEIQAWRLQGRKFIPE